jgi:hypothetical protein
MSCLQSKKLCPLCRSTINSKDLKAGLVEQQQGAEEEDWDAAAAAAAGEDGSRVVVCDSKLKVLLKVSSVAFGRGCVLHLCCAPVVCCVAAGRTGMCRKSVTPENLGFTCCAASLASLVSACCLCAAFCNLLSLAITELSWLGSRGMLMLVRAA